MAFEQTKSEEIGKIERPDTSDIVVRLTEFKGTKYVDIRNWVDMEQYTGFTKKGVAIREQDFPALMKILKKVEKKLKKDQI